MNNANVSIGRLALGTAQFGQPYGIANQFGQVPLDEVTLILQDALNSGATTLDTAVAYGQSEAVLGQHNLSKFDIITKLPEMPNDCRNPSTWVHKELSSSLTHLGVEKLDGLLLHRPQQLLGNQGEKLYQALLDQRRMGRIKRIGISVYGPDELELLCKRFYFDLVQAPFNVIDNRLLTSGWLEHLRDLGTALHVRSVFMQGLLLMPATMRPVKFNRWASLWDAWNSWLSDTGLTPIEACLRYVLGHTDIERIVIGVESLSQWRQVKLAADGTCPSLSPDVSCLDVELLNPALWGNI